VVESSLSLGLINASYAAAQYLGNPSGADELSPTFEITEAEFERRKAFCCFTAEDARRLVELRETFAAHVYEVVDEFYDRLRKEERVAALLDDADRKGRLKEFQRAYLMSLVEGRYDGAYAAGRIRIGQAHHRIGLDPEWYLGSYGVYLDLLLPLIQRHHEGDCRGAVAASASLSKLLVLDSQLVIDAYYGLREKTAVEYTEQLAAVGELAASIAHEVRNPLAGMKGALQVLRKDLAVKPGNLEVVDELLAQIDRLEQLVRDLLTYARPRALRRQRFDLHEMLDRVLRLYKDDSDSLGITVRRAYGPGTGEVEADPTQMEQVFLNLIHNAMQAMEKGGTLSVETRAKNDVIEITFRDTGKGIAAADLPRIFQPFFTTKHRGSGLGLPIVIKIAEAHGGKISLNSELGSGTTATLTLPTGEFD
jgi:signal transduction histidine kinase